MQSPITITEAEQHWLRSRDVSDSPTIGGDQYFAQHNVTRQEDSQVDHLPPAETDAVRAIDREALRQEKLIGKWQVTGKSERIEKLWPTIVADAEAGVIWAVKAVTSYGYQNLPMYDDYLLTVYTPNYFDRDDVFRVRDHLREAHDITHELYSKPDIYTAKGIDTDTAGEFGLSAPARYID